MALIDQSKISLTQVYGNSMFPTIKSGETVLEKTVCPEGIKLYNIIIFKQGEQNICHRVIKIDQRNNCFYTRGDFGFRGNEIVQEKDIIGKVIAIMSNGKIYSLKLQNTFLYYWFINKISFLKEVVIFLADKIYCLPCIRIFLKKISSNKIYCKTACNIEDIKLFSTIYNMIPEEISSFTICSRILGFYKEKFVGKLTVLKDNSNFWLCGPYVKLLYRGRGIGRSLVEEAIRIISENKNFAIYAAISQKKQFFELYTKLGFVKETNRKTASSYILKYNER